MITRFLQNVSQENLENPVLRGWVAKFYKVTILHSFFAEGKALTSYGTPMPNGTPGMINRLKMFKKGT